MPVVVLNLGEAVISEKVKILDMLELEKKIVRGDCQVVWQERIFHS
jgi:hypothetical protein